MKKEECHSKCRGIFIAAFGIFALVGNLVPEHMAVWQYWPVFLIVGGVLKAYHYGFCKLFSLH